MLSCACTLPNTNPNACQTCSVYLNYYKSGEASPYFDKKSSYEYFPYEFMKPLKKVKKIKKTIIRYDENNNFIYKEVIIEEITEEEEIPENPIDFISFT